MATANVAAEKLLVSGFIQNSQTFYEHVEYLSEDDFHSEVAKITFLSVKSLLLEKQVEKVTKSKIVAEAKALGYEHYNSLTKNGEWLQQIFDEQISEKEVKQHFLQVKRVSLINKYLKSIDETKKYLSATTDPLSKVITTVEDKIVTNANLLEKSERSIQQLATGVWAFLDDLSQDPGQLGVDLGFPEWQSRIGQVRNKSITFIAATAKAGKSQFALRSAITAAIKYDIPVLLVDSELNKSDQQIRLTGMIAEVPYNIIETGFWRLSEAQLKQKGIDNQERINEILEYGRRMRDPVLRERVEKIKVDYQSISGMDVPDVIPHIRRWILTKVKPDLESKTPQCLIVYDYIKLATINDVRSGIAEWQLHGINVAALHDLVKEYNVPMIAFGQTNNEIDQGFKCIAGGKRIVENVTSISYLKAKTDEERSIDSNGSHILRVFGARYGSGMADGYINLLANLSFGKFNEVGIGTMNFEEERRRRLNEWRNRREEDADDN